MGLKGSQGEEMSKILTIVVPTYNEGENPKRVITALKEALCERKFEVVFVDDSRDERSMQILAELAEESEQVRYIHREVERGLGTAVVRGFEEAKGNLIAVMDADLQHPPEVLNDMLEQIELGYDMVIPSRFVPGGDDGGLSSFRKFVSFTARVMGQFALKRVRPISDPTSGFFLIRKEVVEGVKLQPIGWKILIEILVRGNYDKVVEIPYRFQARIAGSSNMSLREQWNYLKHLTRLILDSPEDRRAYFFAAVGISGVVINMLVYTICVHLHMALWVSGITAGIVAMISNFVLNDRLTWFDSRSGQLWKRLFKYVVTSLIGIGINTGVLSVLAYGLHVHYIVANAIGIIVAMIWNFYVNNFWTWNIERQKTSVTVATVTLEQVNVKA